MSLETNIYLIINKMCEFKKNNDLSGFYDYIDSLKVDELQDLREFANSLKSLCESELNRKPRLIK